MASWVFKAVLQKAIGLTPMRARINEVFQTYVTRSLELGPETFEDKLALAVRHLDYYRARSAVASTEPSPAPRVLVDIGTGWYPDLPLSAFVCGTQAVHTYDIERHVKPARLRRLMAYYLDYADRGVLTQHLPGAQPERIEQLRALHDSRADTAEALLEPLGIHYHVHGAETSGLPDACVDLVASTVVLEYLPWDLLLAVLRENRRTLVPGGVMSHEIDLADQFHYRDDSITPLHFYRFSDRAWQLINNRIIPMTRLRVNDFRRAFAEAGFEIVEEQSDREPASVLDEVPLAAPFLGYETDDLLVTRTWLVAR
ncbi:MAG: class I SAM-dependent methyltransferase [Bacteroidota bacterium]